MFTKLTTFCLTVIYLSVICETSTPVRRCTGDQPFPLSVQIEDCEELPCYITRGKTASVDIQFVAIKEEYHHLEADVHATVLGIVVPYPLAGDTGNVCKNLLYGAYCPLNAGEDVTYHIDFPLESSVPEVSLKCEIKVVDIDKDVVACFIADLKVRKPRNADALQ